jgi:hypothetical protein
MTNIKVTPDSCNVCVHISTLANAFALDKRSRVLQAHAADHDKVIVKGSSDITLKIGTDWFYMDANVNVSTATDMDTGSVSNGKAYYVYACNSADLLVFKISLNATYPSGFSASNSRKIGGFHTLCVNVGTIGGHTLTGYLANDILPASIWDLKHRPICEPHGMTFDEGINKWVDIYLASGTGAGTASVYNAAIKDTRDWMDFVDDGHAVRKQLLSDEEFPSVAAGSNEETNNAGSVDPVTTGGHSDTAARRMISNIGCEDCTGVMDQWLRGQSAMYDDTIAAGWYDLAGAKGSLYRPVDTDDVKVRAGGAWSDGVNCGSRSRRANHYRWLTHAGIGARFLAEPL